MFPEVTELISIGGFAYAETTDGKHYIWGNVGELAGLGNTDCVTKPKEVNFTVKGAEKGFETYYVFTDTGLYAWGLNNRGQIGSGSTDKEVPIPQKIMDGCVKKVITGDYTAYAITDTGLYAWGSNDRGQVGSGSTNKKVPIPQKIIDGNIKKLLATMALYML